MTHKTGLIVALLGLAGSVYTGWYIVRGPFFGHTVPPVENILVACALFVAAMYLFAWGLDANYRSAGGERPDIDERQDQTMDMPFGPR